MRDAILKKYLLIFLFLTKVGFAIEWKNVSGIYSCNVEAFYSVKDTLIIGTDYGIFKRLKNDTAWQILSTNNLSRVKVSALAHADNILYANQNGKIYSTKDNGDQWILSIQGLPNFVTVGILFSGKYSILAGCFSDGIYRSTNFGAQWQKVTAGLSSPSEYPIDILSSNDTIFMSTTGGFYVSTTDGASWIKMGNVNIGTKRFVKVSDKIYATTSSGIVVSTDIGVTWESFNGNLGNGANSVLDIAYSRGSLFITIDRTERVYKSEISNAQWSLIENAFKGHEIRWIYNFLENIYVGSFFGVFEINTSTKEIREFTNGIDAAAVNDIVKYNDQLLCATSFGYYTSQDGGNTWKKKSDGLENASYSANTICVGDSGIYLGLGGFYYGGGVYFLPDTSSIWKSIGLENITIHDLLMVNDSLYAATLSNGLLMTSNSGTSWETRNIGVKYSNTFAILNSGKELYLGGEATSDFNFTGLYRSTNWGRSWENITKGILNGTSIKCLGQNSTFIFANGLIRKHRDSTEWRYMYIPEISAYNTYSLFSNDTLLYVATSKGLFQSLDDGETWKNISENLSNALITFVTVIGDEIFIGTRGQGMFHRPLSEVVTSVKSHFDSPIAYNLLQNYPNPFNPSTTIRFSIKQSGLVTLKVFDVIGREVKTIINGEYAPGNYSFEFNASHLSTGVYLYRLQSGEYTTTKKMILQK